jgi:hypothetical protein
MTSSWYNGDGLYIKYGPSEVTVTKGGQVNTIGSAHEVELKVTGTAIGSSSTLLWDDVIIPKGARIEEVTVLCETAGTGTGATLNIGLIRTDRTTVYDADGLVTVLPLTSLDLAGERTTIIASTATYAGALLGTTLAYNGIPVVDYDTAAFTAGEFVIRIRYYMI